ncbi:MAG: acyclic terpene utilization AtuA family protein, partial [Erythrobacter sp.]
WHGAKIGECGALCASNPQSGVLQLDFDETGCVVTPLAESSDATPHTVSAHMLYENSDPFRLYEPGGYLDVSAATYTQLENGAVRIEGADWVPGDYTVKLEGARVSGYQTILISLLRDPHYVANAEAWARDIVDLATKKAALRTGVATTDFQIEIRLIGQNATLGALETQRVLPSEVGAMGIVTASSQELANEIGRILNPYLLHHPLTQQEEQPTFAFPFSPAEIDRGPVYEFCLNHVMVLDDAMSAFTLEVLDV